MAASAIEQEANDIGVMLADRAISASRRLWALLIKRDIRSPKIAHAVLLGLFRQLCARISEGNGRWLADTVVSEAYGVVADALVLALDTMPAEHWEDPLRRDEHMRLAFEKAVGRYEAGVDRVFRNRRPS